MPTIKQERAARLIQEIMSDLLMNHVTDPALLDVTVTGVEVDREIEYADVYVHSLDEHDEVMAGLQRANGFLRRELAARTRFRRTPQLHFHWDVAIDHGERIDELLNAITQDQEPGQAPADSAATEGDDNTDEA